MERLKLKGEDHDGVAQAHVSIDAEEIVGRVVADGLAEFREDDLRGGHVARPPCGAAERKYAVPVALEGHAELVVDGPALAVDARYEPHRAFQGDTSGFRVSRGL